jgi:Pyridoxamine 5'-phosphate oxidase
VVSGAKRWGAFAAAAPELAAAGTERLYNYGPGLAFLATVRADGAPRVHPVCPAIVGDGLWVLIGPSPKLGDLRRDGRYALHSFPDAEVDDEFYISGVAVASDDQEQRAEVRAANLSRGATSGDEDALFELLVDRALHSKYGPRPSWPPEYTRWGAV